MTYNCFQNGGCSPSRILQIQILITADTVRRVNMRICAEFLTDRSNRCGDNMAIFRLFSKQRPSAILDSLYACLDHPQSRTNAGNLSLCKIWVDWCSSFDNMQVLIMCVLGMKYIFTLRNCFGGISPHYGE